jgi:hypothetical protein
LAPAAGLWKYNLRAFSKRASARALAYRTTFVSQKIWFSSSAVRIKNNPRMRVTFYWLALADALRTACLDFDKSNLNEIKAILATAA